ncbi:uncharacterized protein MYCFIDRAFT_183847 [Pseudocercospora fijiensis CIRAD86]|uniref:Uncharacterized protein n=1 Tax=Pseudocercospora fijiensis (strain CIRAD86) TaxID=383855 RepID=M3ALG9_PSEFD|nr:uncharacterized protein MYCFIDRAFT_183847 [Pseudocercospora fijiensis CIRAD86]EME78267.1 hypothetical protein MYCFIDRAFT_183847 [Pseudocercospora fijiensis CIRAD86]
MLMDYRRHPGAELEIYKPYEAAAHMPGQFEEEMAITESSVCIASHFVDVPPV